MREFVAMRVHGQHAWAREQPKLTIAFLDVSGAEPIQSEDALTGARDYGRRL